MRDWKRHAAALGVLLLLAGCRESGNSAGGGLPASAAATEEFAANNAAAGLRSDPSGAEPARTVYDPPIVVTVVRDLGGETTFAQGESINDNAWTRFIRERLGIVVHTAWTAGSEQTIRRLNVAVASNQLPDYFSATAAQLRQLAAAGQLAELGELVERYGSERTKARIAGMEGGVQAATFDGRLLAVPAGLSVRDYAPVLWIRDDWLRRLGLQAPATMNDVLAIAAAFADKDPDGNGKDDTYGLGLHKGLFGANEGYGFATIEGFFNGFGAYPFSWVAGDNGRLAYGGTQPATREALLALQRLYREGRIDPDFAIKDEAGVADLADEGRLGMAYGAMWSALNPLYRSRVAEPAADWQAYPIAGAAGPADAQTPATAVTNYYVASRNADHPEALIRMLNLYAELDDPAMPQPLYDSLSNQGVREIWKYFPFNGFVDPDKNLLTRRSVAAALSGGSTDGMTREQLATYAHVLADRQGGTAADWAYSRIFGEGGSMAIIDGYIGADKLRPSLHGDFRSAEDVELFGLLQRMEVETYTRIVQGESILLYDDWLERWRTMGGERLTAAAEASRQQQSSVPR
ncbi:extracellular solute-binding protein [Cohnella sp. GCM10012308]|uniref:extracellular solute-binding protein n=1 Tax=Cohnella sp. GCM10012308 TaxID=3317329 RepID=UPI003621B65B